MCNTQAIINYILNFWLNSYIPDNQFRSRDPKFKDHKTKYKNKPSKKDKTNSKLPASDFNYDPINLTCTCPASQQMSFRCQGAVKHNNIKVFFEGRLSQCRQCDLKTQCIKKPASANHRKGNGRQVAFVIKKTAQ